MIVHGQIGMFVFSVLAFAAFVKAQDAPPRIHNMFVGIKRPGEPPGDAGAGFHRATFGGRVIRKDGEFVLELVIHQKGPYNLGPNVMVTYPPLKNGCVVPILGQQFQVQASDSSSRAYVRFKAVDDDKVPEAIRLTPPSFVIPCRSEEERNEQTKGGIATVFEEFVMLKSI